MILNVYLSQFDYGMGEDKCPKLSLIHIFPICVKKSCPAVFNLRRRVVVRYLYSGAFCQKLHRLSETEALNLHNEVYNSAALAAAKTVVNLFVYAYRKRRGFLIVKRAKAKQVVSAPLCELHIAAHHVHLSLIHI